MERHELEQQLRDTLTMRADRVQASPDLWERVADATTRRSRWRRPSTWLGLASVAALLVAALVIVPNLRRDPGPIDIAETPSGAPTTDGVPSASGTVAGDLVLARDDTNDLGGNGALYRADPVTGEVTETLAEGQPERDAPFYEAIAIRPDGSAEIATVVNIEGQYDLRVGQPGDPSYLAFQIDAYDEALEPRVEWSQDGRYLAWTQRSADGAMQLAVLDVVAFREEPREGPVEDAQTFTPSPWQDGGPVELLDVVGVHGTRLVARVSVGSQTADVELQPVRDCAEASCEYELVETEVVPVGQPGQTLLDVADSDTNPGQFVGPEFALTLGDGPDPRVELLYAGDGDLFGFLELPDELAIPTATTSDMGMDAAGSTVVITKDGDAWLLEVDLDATEPAITSVTEVPGGATVAALAPAARDATTSEDGATEELSVQIDTVTTSPDGNPVNVDGVQLVGGELDPSVRSAVNDDLAATTDDALSTWDETSGLGEVGGPPEEGYEFTRRAEVTRLDDTLVSVEWSGFVFAGGASGFGFWDTATYDLTTGERLAFDDLLDLSDPATAESFATAVADAFVAAEGAGAFFDADGLADELAADASLAYEQVNVTDKGFRFHADEGSLGPNASGMMSADVIVPDVVSFVRPEIVARYFTDGPVQTPTPVDETDPAGVSPEVVVSRDEADDTITISGTFGPAATAPRPEGVLAEEVFVGAWVVPTTVPGRAVVLTEWFIGDSGIRARTVVQNGEVVVNETLEPSSHPNGTLVGVAADTRPAVSPDGGWIAWVENVDPTTDRGYQLAVETWDDGAPTGRVDVLIPTTDRGVANRAVALARTPDGLVAHLAVYEAGQQQLATGMLVVTIPVTNGVVDADAGIDVADAILPGALLGGGVLPGPDGVVLGLVAGDDGIRTVRRLDAGDATDGSLTTATEVLGATDEGLVVTGDDGLEIVGEDGARAATGLPDGLVAVR